MGVVAGVDLLANGGEKVSPLLLVHGTCGRLFRWLFETLVGDQGMELATEWVFLRSMSVERGVVLGSLGDGAVGVAAPPGASGVVTAAGLGLWVVR